MLFRSRLPCVPEAPLFFAAAFSAGERAPLKSVEGYAFSKVLRACTPVLGARCARGGGRVAMCCAGVSCWSRNTNTPAWAHKVCRTFAKSSSLSACETSRPLISAPRAGHRRLTSNSTIHPPLNSVAAHLSPSPYILDTCALLLHLFEPGLKAS